MENWEDMIDGVIKLRGLFPGLPDEKLLEMLKLEEFENDLNKNAESVEEQKKEEMAFAKRQDVKKDALLIQFKHYMKNLEAMK